ncbi:hypothetical protein BSZ32_14950 [Rubritalea profundi]|uniref:ABC-three component systems C-terminal domain-containing protein n=1 Tax=Rubritalea profundi TaxID=1658618 RepID=A0A2S7U3R3_9BACT|nr:hypothetical protein BSZ32_14950 [Rubritalea profundi]
MFPEEGNNADICHIEALSPGGPRYNPDSSDEERNAFPNLMLLCKTHHGIIDQVDTAGQPYYNTHQLKQMKQARRDWFEASRATLFSIKTPSLLSKIVHSLSSLQAEPKPANVSHPFKIDAKIDFNALSSRHYGIIHKYSVYYHSVECLYNELEPAQKASLLEAINDIYLSCQRPSISSDDLWDNVESKLIEKLNNESKHEYSEPLEWCVNIIMVDAFMRCKILEEPKV